MRKHKRKIYRTHPLRTWTFSFWWRKPPAPWTQAIKRYRQVSRPTNCTIEGAYREGFIGQPTLKVAP